jgi:hypothetical protein
MTAVRPAPVSISSRLGGFSRACLAAMMAIGLVGIGSRGAVGQTVVYRPVVTGFAPAAGPYVANYTPSGNYAAVSAFSPPVTATAPMLAISTPMAAVVPSSSFAVTSYAPPAMMTVARPVTAYYSPTATTAYYAPSYAPAATTAYYAPTAAVATAGYAPAAEVIAPAAVAVTSYYAPSAPVAVMPVAPAAVAVPLYRRGPFGGLRPVRGAYWPAY